MGLLGNVGQVEAHFSSFRDSVNIHTRLVHDLRQTCNRLRNCFWHTRWNSYVTWVKWKLILVHLVIVLISVHGLGLTYHKQGNSFGQTMEVLGEVGQMEDRFGLF
jgi:hypothetical protein